ncbi:hypothetical protein KIN20_008713 [Parelaphostrongylus tenuis]|uniref:Uncharacterized protein n=1 Tax=Parelaphostrongylus tenuis TaxID=148309 RepID=A0AAD5MPF2_PARTN|nr:hypothetical protein KIN20_008713 [Parelaphostrongylus tenuis]
MEKEIHQMQPANKKDFNVTMDFQCVCNEIKVIWRDVNWLECRKSQSWWPQFTCGSRKAYDNTPWKEFQTNGV